MIGRVKQSAEHHPGRALIVLYLLFGATLAQPTTAASGPALRLPRIFGEHMVLQRDMPVPIWGWAAPGEEIVIQLAGQEVKATADDRGRWTARLAAMPAGGPHPMTIAASRSTIAYTNVAIGEVWLCSGQSNMQFGLNSARDAREAIAAAGFPLIRHITVANVNSRLPLEDAPISAPWTVCDPRTAGGFSAVAFYFGREIHRHLQVPVGLIHSSWGGTAIEPWTPPEGFAAVTNFAATAAAVARIEEQARKDLVAMLDGVDAWSATTRRALADKSPVPAPPNPAGLLQNGGPSGIYNAMIHPLIPCALRGAIWYQGESNFLNTKDGMIYARRMEALVGGWRKRWGLGDFPFYYVQIAPFKYNASQPQGLPVFWEAQTASMAITNTGMAVINDIGDPNDIHPKRKAEVGHRLALWALARTYGQKDLVYSGPRYKSMQVEGAAIRLTFDHVGGGLMARDGKPLDSFEIAGSDGKFVPASAETDGQTIIVSSDQVPQPATVRFAWSNIACPNLMNKEGLPCSAFRTGSW